MPGPKLEFRQGRIIWAYLRTAQGKREEHPAVILTPTADIIQPEDFDSRSGMENAIVVAGISTKYERYLRVIYAPDWSGRGVFVITAYDLTGKPLAAYRRRMRRRGRK